MGVPIIPMIPIIFLSLSSFLCFLLVCLFWATVAMRLCRCGSVPCVYIKGLFKFIIVVVTGNYILMTTYLYIFILLNI